MDRRSRSDVGTARHNDAQSSSSSSDRPRNSANRSLSSSAAASKTPSKVLSDKFNSLDAQWVDHKAKSPIKVVRARRIRRRPKSSEDGSVASGSTISNSQQQDIRSLPTNLPLHHQRQRRRPEPSPGIASLDRTSRIRTSAAQQEDDLSVGNSTISTLSSTESVFDRLYRSGIRSPRAAPRSTAANVAKKKLASPKPRIKNRLEAYETKSLGEGITTARTPKRGTVRNLFFTEEEDQDVLSSSSSVFARLHRNEKRPEKLWTKPPAFTPKLSNARRAHTDNEPETALEDLDIYALQESTDLTLDDYRNEVLPLSVPIIDTTIDQDLEEIKRLGQTLGSTSLDDSSPTVTATSVSTNVTPTTSTHYNLVAAAASMDPTVDEEFSMLEAVGKQLDRMEQDQIRFLSTGEPSSSSHVPLQTYSALHEVTFKGQLPAIVDTHTESTCGASDTFGFFTLDNSSRSYFFAEKIERLTSPIRRRRKRSTKTQDSETVDMAIADEASCDVEPLITPRRLRLASSITIQRSWRIHTAEVELASSMICSWKTNFWPLGVPNNLPCTTRQKALCTAIKSVDCWWILEGVHIEDRWMTVAWEKQFLVENIQVQVNFDCEARLLRTAVLRWGRRKTTKLLVKAGLRKALRGERAAFLVQLWYRGHRGKLNKTAKQLQHWIRQITEAKRKQKTTIRDQTLEAETISPPSNGVLDVERWNLRDEIMDGLSSPLAPSRSFHPDVEHFAAIKIQSWFRVTTLKAAIKRWPSKMGQLRSALKTAGSSQEMSKLSFDEFDAARGLLCSSMIARRLEGVQFTFLAEEPTVHDGIAKRAAALAIHNIVRAYIAGLKKFRDKQKVILIQSVFRGYSARKNIELQNYAAVVIQFAWSNQRYFRVKARNAVMMQSFWRMVYCQSNYRLLLFCIVFLQASWRRGLDRHRFLTLKSAALLVQKCWRGSRTRNPFLTLRSAVLTLQHSFQRKRTIALYNLHCRHARVLQTVWRVYDARKVLRKSLDATICIQSRVRGSRERKLYFDTLGKIVSIQQAWRHFCWQKMIELEHMLRSSIVIQSFWRSSSIRGSYHRIRFSTIFLQKLVRGGNARRLVKGKILAVTTIQAGQRMAHFRLLYRSKLGSITKIQSISRMVLVRKAFQTQVFALIAIQRLWRGHLARVHTERRKWERAVSSATCIQNMWRTSTAQDAYIQYRLAAISIQSLVRMFLARSRYQSVILETRQLQSSVKVQSLARGHLVRRDLRNRLEYAIAIQAVYRGFLARCRLQSLAFIATLIQSTWRKSKHVALFKHKSASAVLVQALWRGSRARDAYSEARISSIVIQSWFRGARAVHKYHGILIERRRVKQQRSSVLIQRTVRMYLAENYLRDRLVSVRIIQSTFRMILVRSEFLATVSAAIKIQSSVRGLKARSLLRHQKFSATRIQTLWRVVDAKHKICQLRYTRARAAIVVVQKYWRASFARSKYSQLRCWIVLIQSLARGFLCRKHLSRTEAERRAVVSIQRHYRGYRTRRVALVQHLAAVLLQTHRKRAQDMAWFAYSRKSAVKIQALVRGHLVRQLSLYHSPMPSMDRIMEASTLIQMMWRGALARDFYERNRVAAITIQAVYRGSQVREEWWFVRLLVGNKVLFDACARRIQITFALWKLELAVWEMKSLSVLLHRGVRAQLDRSVVQYALFHMTCSMHSVASKSYFHLAASQEQGAAAMILWHRAVGHARNSAAIVIQSYARGALARRHLLKVHGVYFARVHCHLNAVTESEQAASRIQRVVRAWLRLRLLACIDMQRLVRGWIARRTLRRLNMWHRLFLMKAVTTIQAFQRRSSKRSQFLTQRRCAIQIQCVFRGHTAFTAYSNLRVALSVLQRCYRERRRLRQSHLQAVMAALRIQSSWRMALEQKRLEKRREELVEKQERITSHIALTAMAAGTMLVEQMLSGQAQSATPCLSRLVDRVSAALAESSVSKGAIPELTQFTKIDIPLPRQVKGTQGEPPTGPSTKDTCHKVDDTSTKSRKVPSLKFNQPFTSWGQLETGVSAAKVETTLNDSMQEHKEEETLSGRNRPLPSPIKKQNGDDDGWNWASEW